MLSQLDQTLRFHQQALSLRDTRQQILASNIANADTPNYKARDIDFKAALASALPAAGGTPRLAVSTAGHIAASAGSVAGAPVQYRTSAQDSIDGNTVDMDMERTQFADNALHYEANLTLLNSQLKLLMSAIKG